MGNYYRNKVTLSAAVTNSILVADVAANSEGFLTMAGGEQVRFAIMGSASATIPAVIDRGVQSGALLGWYDTQKYRIRFKTGCSDDSHCNNNGKNTLMSDTSAKCNHGGFCVCNPGLTVADAYFGTAAPVMVRATTLPRTSARTAEIFLSCAVTSLS